MWLRCQSNIFPFPEQSNSDISLINSDFSNFLFSKDTNIVLDENPNSCFTECSSIETPFNGSDHPVSIDSKYYDVNDFNKLIINKSSSFATLHLHTASLSKHFDDLQNFLSLLKHSFDIIGISERKINKNFNECWFYFLLCRDILFILRKPKAPTEEQVFLFLTT